MKIDLSVIIVSFNTKKLLVQCVESIIQNTNGINFEIIVVDNASYDKSADAIKKIKKKTSKVKIEVIQNKKNLGYAGANNQGMKKASGDYLLLLNSDTIVEFNVLGKMLEWMKDNKKVGIATCSLLNKDRSIQETGGYFPTLKRVFFWMTIQNFPFVDLLIKPFHPKHDKSPIKGGHFYSMKRELDWITGAFFLIRRKVYRDIGLMDPDYFMYTEDVDYCFRAKQKGWKMMYVPAWSIIHLGGASGSSWSWVVPEFKGVKLFYKKHYPSWQYPFLRLILKIGALGRMFVLGILKGKEAVYVYSKAFKEA